MTQQAAILFRTPGSIRLRFVLSIVVGLFFFIIIFGFLVNLEFRKDEQKQKWLRLWIGSAGGFVGLFFKFVFLILAIVIIIILKFYLRNYYLDMKEFLRETKLSLNHVVQKVGKFDSVTDLLNSISILNAQQK